MSVISLRRTVDAIAKVGLRDESVTDFPGSFRELMIELINSDWYHYGAFRYENALAKKTAKPGFNFLEDV